MKPVNDNTYIAGKKHVDGKRLRADGTPWLSKAEVLLNVISGDRVESQEFYIVDKLWWFKGGVEDENLVEKLEGGTGELISKFTSTVIPTVDDSTIVIPANNTWLFDSVPYTNTVTNVLPFDYAAEGFSYFLTIVATKFNTFVAKAGSQSISNPDEPIIDEENELFLTTYLIYDNYIDVVIPPVNSNIYVEKESFLPLNLFSSGHVASIELDKRNNIIFSGNITKTGNVIKNNSNHFVIGLPFMTTNKTANPIEIQHLNTSGGSGSIAYFNTEELSYFLQPNEVAIWVSEILNGQKIHRRVSSYIDKDSVIFRSGTKVGKPVTGDVEIGDTNGISTEEIDGMRSRIFCDSGRWYISILGVDTNLEFQFNPDKGILSNKLFDIDNDENTYLQKGHIVQLEEDVFNLELNKANQDTTYTKTEVDAKVASVYKIRGSVANFAALPSSGQVSGDVWNLLDNGDNYAWVLDLNNTGLPGWDKLSGNVDLTAIIADLSTKQTKPIIISANKTAVNDEIYHNNGNNTFTDPTPENNKGFYVLNVSGSPTIGGNAYSVGTYLFRYFDGTFWITNVIQDNRFSIKLTITGNITTSTNDASGYGQDGRNVILDNGATALNLTVNSNVTSTYLKTGSGAITFVQGAGRTLVLGNATDLMNGIAGSTARIISDGTIDYLMINNV